MLQRGNGSFLASRSPKAHKLVLVWPEEQRQEFSACCPGGSLWTQVLLFKTGRQICFFNARILQKKVCVLQDLRPNTLRISWDSMLVWLEGAPLTVALPRNSFAEDVLYTDAAPVFISAAEKFRISTDVCIKENIQDPQIQNDMMDSRFRFFAFPRSRSSKDLIICSPCPCCFSLWLQVGLHPPRQVEPAASSVAEEATVSQPSASSAPQPFSSEADTAFEEVCDMEEEDWPTVFEFDGPEESVTEYPYYEDCA